MADSYATPSRSVSSRPLGSSGSSSAEEGCTDTNAYWARLHRYQCLLGKAAQTPMLTREGCIDTNAYWARLHRHHAYWGRLHRHQCLLGKAAQTPVLTREGCIETNAY